MKKKFKRSFLKWPGGKYRILDKLIPLLPPGKQFIEPFAGSCVVSLNTDYPNYILSDANSHLINVIQHVVGRHIDREDLLQYFTNGNNKDTYESLRAQFNKSNCCLNARIFIYLNRHCFNGLWRVNADGKFNVPFGNYKSIYFPIKEIEEFKKKFENVSTVSCSNFYGQILCAGKGDVVYCDPPYLPLSSTSNFTQYTKQGFGFDQHKILVSAALQAAKNGAVVFISNHDTEVTRDLYKESCHIVSLDVRRSISANKEGRKKVKELITIF